MATVVDCADPVALLPGMRAARTAIAQGQLVVLPTDTVYGIGADAFQPHAVQALLDAKGRGRQAPPPVLVPSRATLDALAETVPPAVETLVDALWPGALTVVLPARSTLVWDLGETGGTVALRMPDQALALELLAETGPLAVSSANRTGEPAATTAAGAQDALGDAVEVYLDGGPSGGELPSTIVDATALADGTGPLTILRHGAIPEERLRELVPQAFEATLADASAAEEPDEPTADELAAVSVEPVPVEPVPVASVADEGPGATPGVDAEDRAT